jgi:hypothetical protein
MIVKPPPVCSIYPVRFARPSVINDTLEAWAKLERDYRKFLQEMREAVDCFGAQRLERDLHDIIKGQRGRTPDQKLDALLLQEHDLRAAKGKVNYSKLARGFHEKHHLHHVKVEAVRKRLIRALDDRERQVTEKAEFDKKLKAASQQPSIIGTKSLHLISSSESNKRRRRVGTK